MGLTKEQKRDYQREYMRKRRSNNPENAQSSMPNPISPVTGIPVPESLLLALGDDKQRGKLRSIYESLQNRNLAHEVYYGISGITFEDIGKLLEAFT
jgi:hypothetical protein